LQGWAAHPAQECESVTTNNPKSGAKAKTRGGQFVILGGLGIAVACIGLVLAGLIVSSWDTLVGDPTTLQAAGPTPVAAPSSTPTLVPATASPTPLPTPTATIAVAPEFINKDKIADIKQFVERWRDLSPAQEIPLTFLTQAQVRAQYAEDSLDQKTLSTIARQREFYLALGLMEPDVDLVQAVLDSTSDILLGYYTPGEKQMYVIAESVNMFAQEEMTFAHEYTHALQDQYFDLGRIFDQEASADELIAARAVPEGDARLVEALYTFKEIDQTQVDYNVYRYLMADHPDIEGISPALGILTYFPYTAGEYFMIYLYVESGYNWDLVNKSYERLPLSSEQVLHPEKYLANERPRAVAVPDLAASLGPGWREIDRDVLGEIGLLVWLIDQTEEPTAVNGAAGWAGDQYTLWIDEADRRVLANRSTWDTSEEAVEFFEAFNHYMKLRLQGSQVNGYEEASARIWEHETGVTLLSRSGQDILILVAPDRATTDAIRTQFGGF
jgi:hypothetical protein